MAKEFSDEQLSQANALEALIDGPNDKTHFLGEGVVAKVNHDGTVYLIDELYNCALYENGMLVDYLTLPCSGTDGTFLQLQSAYERGLITEEEDLNEYHALVSIMR